MFYVTRNVDGTVLTVSKQGLPGAEALDSSHPDIRKFFGSGNNVDEFESVDAEFVRVIEDLIDTLILKNVIRHTDLPQAAQKKLLLRKSLRSRNAQDLDLFGDDAGLL